MTWSLAIAAAALVLQQPSPAPGGSPPSPPIHPIDRTAYLEPGQYAFLDGLLDGVEIVSLGESIHMTHEFPLVRIGMIRYLNEHLGFHVLGLEGGPEDIWLAQDRLLASAGTTDDARTALQGLVGVWNTPEVRHLIEYEVASWRGSNPLYLTAYDVQPGIGRGSPGSEAFRQLGERLPRYAPPDPGFDLARWVDDLSPLADQCRRFQPADSARITRAIDVLDCWTERARPAIERAVPAVPHGLVATLIPENLRASLRLCQSLQGVDFWARYKGLRDTQAAPYALLLASRMPDRKLMLWAHLDHVFYNHEQFPILTPAVGELLRRSLGPRVYTIVPLAESGSAVLINVDPTKPFAGRGQPDGDVGFGRIHGATSEVGRWLSSRAGGDYFLDLRGLGPGSPAAAVLSREDRVWIESSLWRIATARDFDAIVWIKQVHAPDWSPGRLLLLGLLGYRRELTWGLGLSAALLVTGLILRRRRRRLAPSRPG